jgi:thiosulfate dehydrogenase [quinone] large subunit
MVMGWTLFQAGIVKLLDAEWSAAGFLQFAVPEGNPFIGLWQGFAGSPLIDGLVAWGFTLIGLGLILGALVRWNAFWGAVMMLFFWAASLYGGLGQGLPLEHGWVVDDHIVYALLLFGLGAFGAGRILGVDAIIEQSDFIQGNPRLRYFLG